MGPTLGTGNKPKLGPPKGLNPQRAGAPAATWAMIPGNRGGFSLLSETQKQSLQESILEILRNLTSSRATAHVLLFAFFSHVDCHFFFPDKTHEVVSRQSHWGVGWIWPQGGKNHIFGR